MSFHHEVLGHPRRRERRSEQAQSRGAHIAGARTGDIVLHWLCVDESSELLLRQQDLHRFHPPNQQILWEEEAEIETRFLLGVSRNQYIGVEKEPADCSPLPPSLGAVRLGHRPESEPCPEVSPVRGCLCVHLVPRAD